VLNTREKASKGLMPGKMSGFEKDRVILH